MHAVQQLAHGNIAVGQNVAFALFAHRAAVGDARGNIAHINKIVPAVHARRQSPPACVDEKLRNVAARKVVRAAKPAREHDGSVKPFFPHGTQHNLRSLRFCFSIKAFDLRRVEIVHLGDDLPVRQLGQSVYRAHIYQFFHMRRNALRHHVACALHVYRMHALVVVPAD